ncbi:hypothetical protein [Maribacter halichondriae]|uniref:hypothetical protein n=1 Tax=Maribacter halichondriae TaxID=2980554 RepID=UPI0023585B71|nr:hypothetical protein [Maribacter sp. Hal144]
MKYEIHVEGGFTGIPKKYEGNIDISEKDTSRLLDLMNNPNPLDNDIRDGFLYHVTLFDTEKTIEAQFDEKTLPPIIRQLMTG